MIAIIDYDAGNVKSVQNALKKLGFEAEITSDIETIKNAEKVIFPLNLYCAITNCVARNIATKKYIFLINI